MTVNAGATILASDIINSTYAYAADSGASDTYAISLPTAPASYVTGAIFRFKANTLNTGAASLNVNGLGAKTIKKNVSVDLATGDILANQIVAVIYDGTNFQLLSPSSSTVSQSASGTSSRDMTTASGSQTIAHGLGVIPKRVVVRGYGQTTTAVCWSIANWTPSGGPTYFGMVTVNNPNATDMELYNGGAGSDQYHGTVSADATNITISWTKSGSSSGTATLSWDAIG